MPTCVPIKELKDTASFSRTVMKATGPITVTKNGYDTFVVMKSDEYEAMQIELSKLRLFSQVAQAEHDYSNGNMKDGPTALAELKANYGSQI